MKINWEQSKGGLWCFKAVDLNAFGEWLKQANIKNDFQADPRWIHQAQNDFLSSINTNKLNAWICSINAQIDKNSTKNELNKILQCQLPTDIFAADEHMSYLANLYPQKRRIIYKT